MVADAQKKYNHGEACKCSLCKRLQDSGVPEDLRGKLYDLLEGLPPEMCEVEIHEINLGEILAKGHEPKPVSELIDKALLDISHEDHDNAKECACPLCRLLRKIGLEGLDPKSITAERLSKLTAIFGSEMIDAAKEIFEEDFSACDKCGMVGGGALHRVRKSWPIPITDEMAAHMVAIGFSVVQAIAAELSVCVELLGKRSKPAVGLVFESTDIAERMLVLCRKVIDERRRLLREQAEEKRREKPTEN